MMNVRLLLIEDNERIMNGNIRKFKREGYEVDAALTLADARAVMKIRQPDAIILDVMLPDGSGLDFITELRQSEYAGTPVLLLTGLGTKEDVVRGLTAGGDDYLTKPYNFDELLARVEALIRRAGRVPTTIIKEKLSLDITAGIAMLDGVDLLLTQKEFAVLLVFTQNEERFLSAEYLYDKAWKAPVTSSKDALKSVIKRLRAKIEGSGWHILWSRGEGYIFERE